MSNVKAASLAAAAAAAAAPAGPGVTGPRPADRAAALSAPADEGHPARWWILAVLAAVAFMAQLDGM